MTSMSARETQMAEAMTDYRTHALQAKSAMTCAGGDCTDEHEHDGDELAWANTHSVLASAAAAMFQGLAALEAADRMAR